MGRTRGPRGRFQKETKSGNEDSADKMNENNQPEPGDQEQEPAIYENFENGNQIEEHNGMLQNQENAPALSDQAQLDQAHLAQDPLAQAPSSQDQRQSQVRGVFAQRARSQYQLDDDEEYKYVYVDFFKGFYNNFLLNLNIPGLDETIYWMKRADYSYEQKKRLNPSLVKSHFEVYIGGLVCQKVPNGDGYNLKKLLDLLLRFVKKIPNPFLYANLLPFALEQIQLVSEEDMVSHDLISKAIRGIVDGLELQSKEADPQKLQSPEIEIVETIDAHGRSLSKRKKNGKNGATEPKMKTLKMVVEDPSVSRSLSAEVNGETSNQLDMMPFSLDQNFQDSQTQAPHDPAQRQVAQIHDEQDYMTPGPSALLQGLAAQSDAIEADPNV